MLTPDELRLRLVEEIPDWVAQCEDKATEIVTMHQQTFGADHRQSEIELLGWAIKYAGMCGKNVTVVADVPN
ncbi:MAG: hypothetical protein ABIR70_08495 [Bryobacteraceae bacterium]